MAGAGLARRVGCGVAALGVNLAFVLVVDYLIATRLDGTEASRPVRVERFVPAPRSETPERWTRETAPPEPPAAPPEATADPVAAARDRAQPLAAPPAGFDFSSIDLPGIGTGPAILSSALPAAPPGASGDARPGGAGPAAGDGAFAGAGLPELTPLVRVQPTYPMRALQMRVEGYVVVEYTIGRDGSTREIEVVEARPGGFFESAVRKAVSKWQFRPGDLAGTNVSYRQQSRINFRLAER